MSAFGSGPSNGGPPGNVNAGKGGKGSAPPENAGNGVANTGGGGGGGSEAPLVSDSWIVGGKWWFWSCNFVI